MKIELYLDAFSEADIQALSDALERRGAIKRLVDRITKDNPLFDNLKKRRPAPQR
jgi:hypothetical protein